MTGRRIYTAATRRRAPLDLDDLDLLDLLTVILRSRPAARAILNAARHHPQLWNLHQTEFLHALTTLDTVGPSTAATFFITEIYASRRAQPTPPTPPHPETPKPPPSALDQYNTRS